MRDWREARPDPIAELLVRLATHGIPVHLYVHDEGATPRALDSIVHRLTRLTAQTETVLMALADMTATLKKIDDATNNIAADLTALKALIVPGMPQADVDTVQALLDAAATKLQGVAASTPEPPLV